MRQRRLGQALLAGPSGPPATPFPGMSIPEPQAGGKRRAVSGLLAFLLHAAAVCGLVVLAWAPAEEAEPEPIPVRILDEPPAPKTDPAPARRVLAERRSASFAPQAQAVKPQVVNPKVVARAAPQVQAERIQMDQVGPVKAPREIRRSAVAVEKVTAVRSSAPSAQASPVDVEAESGPALRGPREIEAPAGVEVGPRQVVRRGDTVGTGSVRLGEGSSVREGVASNRDVLGSPDGAPLADVRTAVGEGLLDGSGGDGSGGVSSTECLKRPAVQDYWDSIRRRMYSRWVLPNDVPSNQEVRVRFRLDAAGSAHDVKLVSTGHPKLGASAVDALRSAAPFPPMSDPVRCLAGMPIVGNFRNPVAASGSTGVN